MSEITPGKWEVAKGGRSVNAGQYAKIRMEPGPNPEEVQANMALIAASPDLLKAAKIALRGIIAYMPWEKAKQPRALLQIAIAKAEGRSA
jgi:hypothetical protein